MKFEAVWFMRYRPLNIKRLKFRPINNVNGDRSKTAKIIKR